MEYKQLSNGIHVSESDYKGPKITKTNVKFHDIIMPTGTHRIWISLRSRKCKLLLIGIFIFFFMLFVMSRCAFLSKTPSRLPLSDRICKLEDIELENEIDYTQFEGSWYATFTKGLENKLLAYFLEFYDVKAKFILKKDGNFDLRSVGGKFMGYWCPIGEGHAVSKDPDAPEKLSIYFDTPTGKKFGTKPGWILKTDYSSYCIIYSCWEETAEGACKPSSTYIVVLQRSTDKLPDDKRMDVDQALNDVCIDPGILKPIQHYGYCKKERDGL